MSQTATPTADEPIADEHPAADARENGGVLSMNGHEIELSYSEMMEIRSAVLHAKWEAAEDDRPATARWLGRVYDRLGPTVGR